MGEEQGEERRRTRVAIKQKGTEQRMKGTKTPAPDSQFQGLANLPPSLIIFNSGSPEWESWETFLYWKLTRNSLGQPVLSRLESATKGTLAHAAGSRAEGGFPGFYSCQFSYSGAGMCTTLYSGQEPEGLENEPERRSFSVYTPLR